MLKRFVSNGTANLTNGFSLVLYQIIVAAMAARVWEPEVFASWAFGMSFAAMLPALAFSFSYVIARRVTESRSRSDQTEENKVILAGRIFQLAIGLGGIALLLCAAAILEGLRHFNVTATDMTTSVLAILLQLLSNAWISWSQVTFGRFFADGRNWIPARITVVARFGGVLAMFAAISLGIRDITLVAAYLCAGNWIGLLLINRLERLTLVKQDLTLFKDAADFYSKFKEQANIVAGNAIGAGSVIIVQHASSPLFSLVMPAHFTMFYMANVANLAIVGVVSSVMAALLAPFTQLRISKDSRLKSLVLLTPSVCSSIALAGIFLTWFLLPYGREALGIRTHLELETVRSYLGLLGTQSIIRGAASGYAIFVASSGSGTDIAKPLIAEMILFVLMAPIMTVLFGGVGLVYSGIIAALLGSQLSSVIICKQDMFSSISKVMVGASLLGPQLLIGIAWYILVRENCVEVVCF